MGVSIQDRTDFLNMLDACRTEQQLFSRLTFAVMFHQTDPDAREDLLDDVRGAACNMQLPAVNYKIDQWLNTCKQAWQADPAAFMAAVNADAKQRKLALEGSAVQPGLLADVPMQSVAWLVPQLLPLGEVSLLGADGGTGKGIWQAQLIAYVTAGKTSGFFPLPPQQTGKVLLLAGEDDPGKVLKARLLAAGADMNRVLVLTADDYFGKTGQPLTLKDQALADFAAKAGPLLLIVDPLQSFLPADVEMASRNQMRGALLPLRAIAAKQGCAVLIVMHSNKKAGRFRPRTSGRQLGYLGHGPQRADDGPRQERRQNLSQPREKQLRPPPADGAAAHRRCGGGGRKDRAAVFDGYTDKKDADFIEERRVRTAETRQDTRSAILNVLSESRLGSMPSNELRAAVLREIGCSDSTYNRVYSELVKSGEIAKHQINQGGNVRSWFTAMPYRGETSDKVAKL